MADDFTANPGSGGDTFAADDIGGVKYPRSKITIGADGTNDGDVSSANPLPITGTVTATGTVAATQSGTWNMTNAGTFAVQVDAALPSGTNSIGNIGTVSQVGTLAAIAGTVTVASHAVTNAGTFATQPGPTTANGLSIVRDIDLDNGTLTVIKASAGQLYGWDITNRGTVTAYVKFYNATSGTLGTGTPEMTIGIPGNSSDSTLSSKSLAYGIAFGTGICAGAGTGVTDADNTDPGTNIVVANFYYK